MGAECVCRARRAATAIPLTPRPRSLRCLAWLCRVKKMSVTTVTVLLRVLNIANAVGLGFACWYAFQMISGACGGTRVQAHGLRRAGRGG